MSYSSTRACLNRIVRASGIAFVGASIFLPVQSMLASTFDGQNMQVNSGESVQINCASGDESVAQLDQVGNTRYYSLRCSNPNSSSANRSSAPTTPAAAPTVEHSGSTTTLHLGSDSPVHITCYGGSANLDTAGNTRYSTFNCGQ